MNSKGAPYGLIDLLCTLRMHLWFDGMSCSVHDSNECGCRYCAVCSRWKRRMA